jgi:AraC-like DNA-binding protein
MATRDISRCINLVAGMSFNDYINQHRIEQIKWALQTDDYTNLTDLAFAAGFSSKATFNQSFKKATGMTPSEFRSKQYVQNQDSSRLVSRD